MQLSSDLGPHYLQLRPDYLQLGPQSSVWDQIKCNYRGSKEKERFLYFGRTGEGRTVSSHSVRK